MATKKKPMKKPEKGKFNKPKRITTKNPPGGPKKRAGKRGRG